MTPRRPRTPRGILPALRSRITAQDGGTMTVVSLTLALFASMAGGLAVDYSNGLQASAHLQTVADSAALAALQDLPDEDAARAAALDYAAMNADATLYGDVVIDSDVEFGTWDPDTRTFTAGAAPADAVRVRARRLASRGNELDTLLLRLSGTSTFDVTAQAIAANTGGDCGSGGLYSQDWSETGSTNDFVNGFCLHGNEGVKTGSQNNFDSSVTVTMHDINDLIVGSSNTGILHEAAEQGSHTFGLLGQIDPIIATLQGGDASILPSYITTGPVYLDEITKDTVLTPGTFYVVAGRVAFDSGSSIERIAIVAGDNITFASDMDIRQIFFATEGRLTTGSKNDFGTPDYCTTGVFGVHLFSKGKMTFGSQNPLRGVILATQDLLKIGSDAMAENVVYGEAALEIDYGSHNYFGGCGAPLASDAGIPLPTSGGSSLVY